MLGCTQGGGDAAMRRRGLILAAIAFAAPAAAQAPLLDALTQRDASRGVTEALGLAATNATNRLGRVNGFWGDPHIRIPLPSQLASLQRSLQPLGLAGPLDDLELRINRAAEQAMPEAGRIFMSVIRSLTIADAIQIVRGGDNAATMFLRDRTEPRLIRLVTPIMRRTLTESGAFQMMDAVARRFQVRSLLGEYRTDVTNFATSRALDGAFTYIASEERAIRRDPVRRTSDILRRVFGP